MTRKDALVALQVAGYHADRKTFARIYVENRISLTVAQEAWKQGERQKQKGMPCRCVTCKHV
jgi:hypothetical protein